ncbi:hypothetical protein PVAP13_7KG080929 [Panicum virgatum]|uniref:Uncharacterized protein n=1 Tax=Panicum virgatum TaxID=38727 RepID=A0A8T0Q8A0_PANVG|nr:hypothetical protein PVAP13_7KG080929 [Panicum virgatum]
MSWFVCFFPDSGGSGSGASAGSFDGGSEDRCWAPHVIPSPISHLSSLSPHRPDSGSPCAAPAPAVSAPAHRPGPGRLPAPPWSPPLLPAECCSVDTAAEGAPPMEQQPSSRKGVVVLMLSSRSLKVRAGLGVGPHAGDDAHPVAAGALGAEEPGQLQVWAEDGRHGLADGRAGHARGQRAGLDVGGELLLVELQEADGAVEARREDSAHAEHGVALAEPAGHMRIHALECVARRAPSRALWCRRTTPAHSAASCGGPQHGSKVATGSGGGRGGAARGAEEATEAGRGLARGAEAATGAGRRAGAEAAQGAEATGVHRGRGGRGKGASRAVGEREERWGSLLSWQKKRENHCHVTSKPPKPASRVKIERF